MYKYTLSSSDTAWLIKGILFNNPPPSPLPCDVLKYVCVVSRMGKVEEGVWHRRRAPVSWWRVPPFHIRIVRPNPAGMLDYMIAKKKVKLVKKVR